MSKNNSLRGRFEDAHSRIKVLFPHLYEVLDRERDFIELRVKMRPDGTCLAIIKEYGPDGGVLVAFGTGYGAIGALLGIDGTIQAGRWKPDTPWPKDGKGKGN